MSDYSKPMRFGAFLAPLHRSDINPTLSLHRDLELAVELDRLGYDELWYGEHHSGGSELISSPELMIAAAAERTDRIKLGTGVTSLPYHHPFTVADRWVQLSHMTRGRAIFGVGPGQLARDARMLGIDPADLRVRMEESLEVILDLLAGRAVTRRSWFDVDDAMLQLRPFSQLDVVVTAAISPSGPRLAGKHGAGMISLAATDPVGIDRLAGHWEVLEHEAEFAGKKVSRSRWRMTGMMHVAETMEQAIRDVEYGLGYFMEYLSHVATVSSGPVPDYSDTANLVRDLNASGKVVIGTPDMAADQISRLVDRSGGFGCFLIQAADIASWPASKRSYELIAEEVIPRFTGQLDPVKREYDAMMSSGTDSAEAARSSQNAATARYEAELKDRESRGS